MSYKIYYKTGILYLLFGVFFLLSSCSSAPKLPKYPTKQVGQYLHILHKDGLKIIVDPMFNSNDNITYFGIDLLQEHILPVFVIVENHSAKGGHVVFNEKIFLNGLNSEGMNKNDKFKGADISEGMNLVNTSAWVGGVPLMLVGLSKISHAAEFKRNLKSKMFQTKIISKGEQCSGFVYFRLPEKNRDMKNLSISLEVMNLKKKHRQTYIVPIDWKGEKL
jgi:hypothetical protein